MIMWGKRTEGKKSVGMGVGGMRKNCTDRNDEIIQNLTRDLVVGNDYDNTKRELVSRKRSLSDVEYDYVDADDEDKYDSHQIGAGKYPRGGKYPRKHNAPKNKIKKPKAKPKKGKKPNKKKSKKKAFGSWSGKKNKKQKGICKQKHKDKWANDIFN